MAEGEAADDRAEIGDDGDPAHGRGIEVVLLLQEGRIEVLRAVGEEVEAQHQHDHVEDEALVLCDGRPEWGFSWACEASNAGDSGTAERMNSTTKAGRTLSRNIARQPIV